MGGSVAVLDWSRPEIFWDRFPRSEISLREIAGEGNSRVTGVPGLGGPARVRVVLGGAVQIADQVRSAELVASSGRGLAAVGVQAVMRDDGAVRVGADPERLKGRAAAVAQMAGGAQASRCRPHVLFGADLR
jgi:hypothetical protein